MAATHMKKPFLFAFAFFLIFLVTISHASDLAKEKRWAEQIIDAIFDGDPITLKDGDVEFLAIYTPSATDKTVDAAILMHGLGVHPDWDQVVRPLRTGLPEQGWATLSLQMPILENGVDHVEYAPLFSEVAGRIDAGLAYLKEQGAKRIVIIGHSLGAAMGSYYLANHQPEIVAGFIGVGMGSSSKPVMDNVVSLKSVQVPVLDLYGENDLDDVVASAGERKKVIASHNNPVSTQKMVAGAGHFFDGKNEELMNEVVAWLNAIK